MPIRELNRSLSTGPAGAGAAEWKIAQGPCGGRERRSRNTIRGPRMVPVARAASPEKTDDRTVGDSEARGSPGEILSVVTKRNKAAEKLVGTIAEEENRGMRALAGLLVAATLAIGVYYFYMKKMPSTEEGTAPTQAISLTGVRSDLLQIAQAERGGLALNSSCVSLDELISSGALTVSRRERDGYTYTVNCAGSDFEVVAEHPAAAAGSEIRYPKLAIDATMQVREVQ
jgi:hypothetical protein